MATTLATAFSVDISNPKSSILEPGHLQADNCFNARRNSLLGTRPDATPLSLQNSTFSSGSTDSGYASAQSSTSTTPADKPKLPTKDADSDLYGAPVRQLFAHQPTKIQAFDVQIPQSIQNEFDDLMELWSSALCAHFAKSKFIPKALSIKLRVVGENRESAKPCILIQGDPESSKKVKQFFNKSKVKKGFQSQLPGVGVVVCERSPKPLAGRTVYGPQNNAWYAGTLCGTSIKAGGDDDEHESRLATLGGVIRITTSTEGKLYALTTGHIVDNYNDQHLDFNSDVFSSKDSSSDDDEQEDDDDENEEPWFDGDTKFELISSSLDDLSLYAAEFEKEIPESREFSSLDTYLDSHLWPKVGRVAKFSRIDADDTRNFDWALVELDNPQLYRPNTYYEYKEEILGAEKEIKTTSKSLGAFEKGTKHDVFLIGRECQHWKGKISPGMSFLSMAPGKAFIRAYDLILDDKKVLKPGDSGSWVIDMETSALYGHVVASDQLGEGYIIPIQETFLSIAKQLNATSVDLPTSDEIHEWQVLQGKALLNELPEMDWSADIFEKHGSWENDGVWEARDQEVPRTMPLFSKEPLIPQESAIAPSIRPSTPHQYWMDAELGRTPEPYEEIAIDSGYATMQTTPEVLGWMSMLDEGKPNEDAADSLRLFSANTDKDGSSPTVTDLTYSDHIFNY